MAVAVAACACCSCARTESENFNEIEDKALDIWVSSNAPDAEPLGDTGMYYEVIEALPDGSATKVDVRGRWVDVKYVIRDLNGDIVYNRNEETARLLGTFTKYTHYIPDRLYIASRQDLSDIPSGIYQAITESRPERRGVSISLRVWLSHRTVFRLRPDTGGSRPLNRTCRSFSTASASSISWIIPSPKGGKR